MLSSIWNNWFVFQKINKNHWGKRYWLCQSFNAKKWLEIAAWHTSESNGTIEHISKQSDTMYRQINKCNQSWAIFYKSYFGKESEPHLSLAFLWTETILHGLPWIFMELILKNTTNIIFHTFHTVGLSKLLHPPESLHGTFKSEKYQLSLGSFYSSQLKHNAIAKETLRCVTFAWMGHFDNQHPLNFIMPPKSNISLHSILRCWCPVCQ